MYGKISASGGQGSPDQVEGQPVYDEGLEGCGSQGQVELETLPGSWAPHVVRAQGCCSQRAHLEERTELKLGREGEARPQLQPQGERRKGQPQTHNEVHERRRSPGQRHVVAITAEEQPREHAEDHPAGDVVQVGVRGSAEREGWRSPKGPGLKPAPPPSLGPTHHHWGPLCPICLHRVLDSK